ncbi:MAG: hypothetical protein RQ754_00205 [Desulfuromonadales bacterium]|nr:hypothetical protein [Desulfuromonadales bacterium]
MLTEQIRRIRQSHPDNLMARHFDPAYFASLCPAHQKRLQRLILTGIENPESIMGAYAMHPEDYDLFQPYLDKMIRDYHNVEGELKQVSDWGSAGQFDLRKIDAGLADSSMRVRVGRNLADLPLPGGMNKGDRLLFEQRMITVFLGLADAPGFGGRYLSLTPGSPYQIGEEQYQRLVAEHKMFKNMGIDPYLSAAGISSDWPYGRGMYESADGQLIVWVGEEDHLRIMVMKRCSLLSDIFDRLRVSLDVLERQGLCFARSPSYGYVTSCPTNLGTGMRASLHLQLPKLTENGTTLGPLKQLAGTLGLSVRGAGGEHTDAGAGGLVDISPSARLKVTEGEICRHLYEGIAALRKLEQNLQAP